MHKTYIIAEPGKQEIVLTRVFDAPKELVYELFTNPILVPQWWGPKYLTTIVDKMEFRPGGIWRYIQNDKDGNIYAFNGVYHSIVPNERLIFTFEFEGKPGHVLLVTVSFEDFNNMTKLTELSVFQSIESRDGMLESGMEEGAAQTMGRLSELLKKSLLDR